MKTTLELPDELMRHLKVRAAQTDRTLKDVVTDVIRRGLEAVPAASDTDPLQAWAAKLVTGADGSIRNPDGIDDLEFFAALDGIREQSRQQSPRDPFADAG
ncbi:MAG: hypothetical protein J0H50_03400 [Xanthomonadales bacterium]|nr:hypothetical protein [Xanthomonadales bacterium]